MREGRQYVVQGIFIAVGLVFLARLFFLQVLEEGYSSKAEKNVILKVIQYPHRGQIYDRNGKLIVINAPVYDIMMIPKKVKIADTLAFCQLMGLTKPRLDSIMKAARASRAYSSVKPYPFLKQVSNVDFARMQGGLIEYPGFYATTRTIRSYPRKLLANSLGYIGEISKKKLEAPGQTYYKQGDYVGISGVESFYEEQLRGQRGVKYVLVNVRGVEKGSFKNGAMDTTSVAGENLTSSIDIDLQQYAESLMINKIGSIVAIEPSSGEILTMVSTPSYDPNMLTGREFPVNFGPLQKDPLIPLYNRPIQAVYRPGSIFKLVQSLVGLQQGSINSTSFLPDVGPMACHHHSSAKHNGLHNAIQYSCNVYFYQAFRQYIYHKETGNTFKDSERGLMRWRDAIGKFGFGRTLGIDLPNEKRGFVPDTSFFNRVYGKGSWKFSNWYSMAIGEGELGVVPLQMANLAAIIANRGHYYTPHLVKGIGKNGKIDPKYTTRNYVGVDSDKFQVVVDAMADVVRAGTAGLARIDSIIVCGKTGTSENKKGKDHSVFVAFAPKDNPKIAIAVYVENAGFGGVIAAPIASLLMEKYIKGKISKKREHLEKFILEKNFMPETVAPKPPIMVAKKDTTTVTTTIKKVKQTSQNKPASDSILVRDEKPVRQ